MAGSHSHSHDHAHHAHGHAHAPASFGRAFAIGIALNVGFVAVEAMVGFIVNSMALLADAGHNVSDVLGLVVAWGGAMLAKTPPSKRFTYGLRGSTILAALFNALFLLVATGAIALEAIERLGRPAEVPGLTVMTVAAIGIAVNGVTAWLFAAGRKNDLNLRATFTHMAVDAVVSAGVVVAGLLIWLTGYVRIDAIVSLAIVVAILLSTWGLLRDSVVMALDAVPPGIDLDRVEGALRSLPGVIRVHDLHVWPMSTTEVALTAHVVIPTGGGSEFLRLAHDRLAHDFAIRHCTIQIETDDDCALKSPACV